nr:hypothetical protein [Paraburkholderia sp. BL8N3]
MDTAQVHVHARRDPVRVGISACCAEADFRDPPASPLIAIMQRRKLIIALVVAASSLLGGCSLFGCGGSATNGGAFGGCHAGTRF